LTETSRPDPPPHPPSNLAQRILPITAVDAGTILYRIHRTRYEPLYFGRQDDPDRRQRWDAPDASYGVCYMAEQDHIAFAETLLRDLRLDAVQETELASRSLARLRVRAPLRLVAMHGRSLRALGADASVIHGPYEITWAWSAELHAHPEAPDGIRYRARHDDSGFSVALFERACGGVEHLDSTPLLDPAHVRELARWLDRYDVGLTT
jgi:hypothetical protein